MRNQAVIPGAYTLNPERQDESAYPGGAISLSGRADADARGKEAGMLASLSIIVPAYNEARRIGATLSSLETYCRRASKRGVSCEVIVVCDGCQDETERVVLAFASRLPLRVIAYAVNRGKGYAVRRGVAASMGDVVVFMDADGSTPVDEVDRLAVPIQHALADIVVGSRRAADARVEVAQTLSRRVLSWVFAWHTRALLGLRVRDTQCGFKVFRGGVARELFGRLRCDRFAFDLELLVLARERRFHVLECGVAWREVAGSTVHPVRDGVKMLAAAWQFRFRRGPQPQRAGGAWAQPQLVPVPSLREG